MNLTIDHTSIDVPEGTTVMQAAALLGIRIPSMCYSGTMAHEPSCMVCMVQETGTGKFFPSCAMPVQEGMDIITSSPEITELRREALELLLSDHAGDCEAPCRRSCPAFMNIPQMNRLIARGETGAALDLVTEEIALPLILGYICPAPCEKACHRKTVDQPVAICMLKRFTAGDESRRREHLAKEMTENGRKTAVIGSGPAGLSAAFYLRRLGYSVTIFERMSEPGGAMRDAIPEEKLPRRALDDEIESLTRMGIRILTNQTIDTHRFENEILTVFDAVIIATGTMLPGAPDPFALPLNEEGERFHRKTLGAHLPNVFGCGSAVKENRMAVRSGAQGKVAALGVDLFLSGRTPRTPRLHFNSVITHLSPAEAEEYLQECSHERRIDPGKGWTGGFTPEEAIREAARCMHCDCRKPVTCKLRILSNEYDAHRHRFTSPDRKKLTRLIRHDLLVYEPEKCIKCGICVGITEKYSENPGLTFIGRGFDVRIGVPLNHSLREAITHSASACVEGCPTGALSFKDHQEDAEQGGPQPMPGTSLAQTEDQTTTANKNHSHEKEHHAARSVEDPGTDPGRNHPRTGRDHTDRTTQI